MYPFQLAPQDIADPVGLGIVVGNSFRAFGQEVLIIATVDINCPAVHFHDSVAYPVEEIAVMRYHEQSAAGTLQGVFEILYGVDIQVVGGLVHYQEFRTRCK